MTNMTRLLLVLGLLLAEASSVNAFPLFEKDLFTLKNAQLADEIELLVDSVSAEEQLSLTVDAFGMVDLSQMGDIYQAMFALRGQAYEIREEKVGALAETLSVIQLFAEAVASRPSDLEAILAELSDPKASGFTAYLANIGDPQQLVYIPVEYEASLSPQSPDVQALPMINSFLQERELRFRFELPVSIPEPGTFALLSIGLLGMGLARRRKVV